MRHRADGSLTVQTKRIRRLSFVSFVKLTVLACASLGIFLAALNPVFHLMGQGMVATAFISHPALDGPAGWVVYLFLVPIFMALLGLFIGMVTYLPFIGLLRLTRGISLSYEAEGEEANDDEAH